MLLGLVLIGELPQSDLFFSYIFFRCFLKIVAIAGREYPGKMKLTLLFQHIAATKWEDDFAIFHPVIAGICSSELY